MWPALAIIAASAFLKNQANQEATGRRNAFQRTMDTYQHSRAQQTQAATDALLKQQTAPARQDELQGVQADRTQSMNNTVDLARASNPALVSGGVSQDYTRASSAAADTVAARAKRAIEQMAIMGAPGEQGLKQNIRFGRTAGNVDANNLAIANVGQGFQRDIGNVRPDPTMSTIADIGMAAGSGMAGGGGAAGADSMTYGGVFDNPAAADYIDADMAGKNLRTPSIKQRLGNAMSLWGQS